MADNAGGFWQQVLVAPIIGPAASAIGVALGLVVKRAGKIGATILVRDEPKERALADQAAQVCGDVGRWAAQTAEECRDLVNNEEYGKILPQAEMCLHILDRHGNDPVLEHFRSRIQYNLGVGYSMDHRWDEALSLFVCVEANPAASSQLRALAVHQTGMIGVGKYKHHRSLGVPERQELEESAAYMIRASESESLRGERPSGVGVLSIAEIYARCGEWGTAAQKAMAAETILSSVPEEKLADLKNAAEQRSRWPNLAAQTGWLQRYCPSLFAIVLVLSVAIGICASNNNPFSGTEQSFAARENVGG